MGEYDEESLRQDANRSWQPWSLELEGWKKQIQNTALTRQDFSVAPGSGDLHIAFEKAEKLLGDYVHTGEEIFEGIARALLDSAIEYMEMDHYSQAEIDKVKKEMDAL
ncbi:MAG: hypothetical protein JST33_16935 [Actinobacteria bacterium]|nr:hypothetical protein [Actinomycetota bacterium]